MTNSYRYSFQWRPDPHTVYTAKSDDCADMATAVEQVNAMLDGVYEPPRWWQWWRWGERRPIALAVTGTAASKNPSKT